MYEQAQRLSDSLVDLRREVHRHPELGFQEYHTARLIAERLSRLGIAVRTGVAKTGVVGDLGDGRSGPCIALRADMDALPIQEENNVPYTSEVPGGASPSEPQRLHHHSRFDLDERCLPLGAALLAQVASRFLEQVGA